MEKNIWITFLVIGAVLVAGYILYNAGPVVASEGHYSMEVKPDESFVYVSIENLNTTAQIAQEENQRTTDNVVNALLKAGLKKEDIQLSNFNVYQDYQWDNGKRKDNGFRASRQITVKSADFEKIGEIIDAVAASDGLVQSIQFGLSNSKENEYKAEAFKMAGKDAENKAKAIAEGVGKKIGRLVSVQSQEIGYNPYVMYESVGMAKGGASSVEDARAAVVNIDPRDLEISATINVQYKLSLF